jgi:NAD(P)-dependent dehydrogenase (short-subunit alcohol dehydrogenase family)
MTFDGKRRTVVISGASTGIGRCAALTLAERGWLVFAGVRRDEDANALRAQAPRELRPILLDVTDSASIERARAEVEQVVGVDGLGGLVNNAGISLNGPLEFMDLSSLRLQFEVNVIGQVAVIQAFLPLLRRARGRIVNIGSMGGYISNPFQGPYCASKFALEAISDSLRRELRPWGLEVSLIQPGSIDTRIWEKGKTQASTAIEGYSEQARTLYGEMSRKMLEAVDKVAGRAIAPDVVAGLVCHALESSRPRTRYRAGFDAKLVRALTWLLPDRAVDAFLLGTLGLSARNGAQPPSNLLTPKSG